MNISRLMYFIVKHTTLSFKCSITINKIYLYINIMQNYFIILISTDMYLLQYQVQINMMKNSLHDYVPYNILDSNLQSGDHNIPTSAYQKLYTRSETSNKSLNYIIFYSFFILSLRWRVTHSYHAPQLYEKVNTSNRQTPHCTKIVVFFRFHIYIFYVLCDLCLCICFRNGKKPWTRF